jgi:hypothetical protein
MGLLRSLFARLRDRSHLAALTGLRGGGCPRHRRRTNLNESTQRPLGPRVNIEALEDRVYPGDLLGLLAAMPAPALSRDALTDGPYGKGIDSDGTSVRVEAASG